MEFKIWYLWVIIAIFFTIGEIATAGFYLLPFGAAAAVSAILAVLNFNFIVQGTAFVLLSVVFFVLSRKFAEKVTVKQPPGVGADRFIGHEGVVVKEIDSLKDSGLIRVGQDEWRAKSLDGSNISRESIVKVVRIEGTRLIVELKKEE